MKTIGKGKAVFFPRAPGNNELAKAYSALVPGDRALLDGESTARMKRVHFETMIRRDGAAPRIVLHAINYNIRLGKNAPPTEPVDGLKLAIPVPAGFSARAAWSTSPEQIERAEVTFVKREGRIECEMPPFKFYRVLAIDLEKD